MSATQDKSQKVTFVYSNLYQIYKKGKDAAGAADVDASSAPDAGSEQGLPAEGQRPGLTTSQILKTGAPESDSALPMGVRIRPYRPVELLGKRVQKPAVISAAPRNGAVDGLKKNLDQLNELHQRLRFMLKELEDLIKE